MNPFTAQHLYYYTVIHVCIVDEYQHYLSKYITLSPSGLTSCDVTYKYMYIHVFIYIIIYYIYRVVYEKWHNF